LSPGNSLSDYRFAGWPLNSHYWMS